MEELLDKIFDMRTAWANHEQIDKFKAINSLQFQVDGTLQLLPV